MTLQSSFTLIPLAKIQDINDSAAKECLAPIQHHADVLLDSLARKDSSCATLRGRFLIIEDITRSQDVSLSNYRANPPLPCTSAFRRGSTDQQDDPETDNANYPHQNATISYEEPRTTYREHFDDDNSTIATTNSIDISPPLPFISIPRDGRDGVELSKEEWRNMYFSSHNAKRKLQRFSESVLDENRALKRQLIQLQKQVNEKRRNHTTVTTQPQPWKVPVPRGLPKRRRVSLECEVSQSLSVEEIGSHCSSVTTKRFI